MSAAGVVISLEPLEASRPATTSRRIGPGRTTSAKRARSSALAMVSAAAIAGSVEELVVVIADESQLGEIPLEATVLLDEARSSVAGALRSALDWCGRAGHDAVVVGVLGESGSSEPLEDPAAWRLLLHSGGRPITLATAQGLRLPLARLDADVWPMVPLEGQLSSLFESRSELVSELEVPVSGPEPQDEQQQSQPLANEDAPDLQAVQALLGRRPQGRFSVAVRSRSGEPVVIENAPFLDDATPMPTRFWLVGRAEQDAVSRLESSGGAKAAEAALGPETIAAAHRRYAEERDASIDPGHLGPRPSGGVGGTRQGVKCLHAHLAWYLAGGGDPVGRWVTAKLANAIEGAVAAIDCGTNSTRLLVLGRDGSTLAREMTITRLGEGVDQTGSLGEAAIARTIAALRSYRDVCDRFGVVSLRATATSAARDAANSEELFEQAEAVLGVRPELLKASEEGRLSYLGATAGLSGGPYLLVDLGGGSTELVTAEPGTSQALEPIVNSLDVGCVRVTERYLKSDPPSGDELEAARTAVRALVQEALLANPELARPKEMIGVAGTVSSLTSLALDLEHYDSAAVHHQVLSRKKVEELLAELAAEPLEVRRAHRGLEEGRADVIVGGALVLEEVMAASGHQELIHSETDILDGIANELLAPAGARQSR